ncbi:MULTISPECIES: hypothetical protein [Flavobacterium]|uniref:Uncharacterized protein n=1 Tax=Flavobacterium suzhouense TaxID=1529638 RepID=A0ABW5NT45_9FLAO|nr:hypothetical protein [Flavobacterium sp. AG291]RDI11090.1 hypothetical protein DEU42_10619 [Flavobacterium sp. AG291]
MNEKLIEVFTIFITSEDKVKAEENFNLLISYFTAINKDTTHFARLKYTFFNYDPFEIIGIKSALRLEFENLSGIKLPL